jgi:hypothetical protein
VHYDVTGREPSRAFETTPVLHRFAIGREADLEMPPDGLATRTPPGGAVS